MKRYPLNPPLAPRGLLFTGLGGGDCQVEQRELQPVQPEMPHAEQLLALAKKIGESRHRRQNFLATELFAEPGWEMLLALYRADAAGLRMSVSNLCRTSEGPETTAVRWIDRLEDLGMVTRRKSPHDGRVSFVELSPTARLRIHDYLMETWTSLFDEG
jgi:DNA-binding MarR family transcriptional regulator